MKRVLIIKAKILTKLGNSDNFRVYQIIDIEINYLEFIEFFASIVYSLVSAQHVNCAWQTRQTFYLLALFSYDRVIQFQTLFAVPEDKNGARVR